MIEGPDAVTAIAALVVGAIACSIAVIDLRRQIIPDGLNVLLGVSGLAYSWNLDGRFPAAGIAGAVAITALFFLVREWHFRRNGAIGLGLGDVKMACAAALWLNPLDLPLFLLIASLAAIVCMGLVYIRNGGELATRRLPFGPFLGIALLAVWLRDNFPTLHFHSFI